MWLQYSDELLIKTFELDF